MNNLSREQVISNLKEAINNTHMNDLYSIGMRNGLRYALSLLTGDEPHSDIVPFDYFRQPAGFTEDACDAMAYAIELMNDKIANRKNPEYFLVSLDKEE